VIFKVVPMINPDGVVFGNYRTGLAGKDLNRKFKAKSIDLFPEVINLRKYVEKNKKELECKILYFLDFHGHSIKKNVFLYGP
jgi:murein tripeptide amidase MpaA